MRKLHIHGAFMPDGQYHVYDDLTYDVDCDQDGFYPTSLVGSGKTYWDAIRDLVDQLEDEDETL